MSIYWTGCQKIYVRAVKPAADIFFAILGLVLLSPLFLLVAVAIKIDSRGPVFFRQERVGKNARVFTIIKFRSMAVASEKKVDSSEDMMRMTRVGHFIRRLSIDEFPQVFNIIGGKMSFIGPRPLLVDYLPRYTPEQMKRHNVMPGMSGWSQVNGRNAARWKDKFQNDVWYVDNVSFILDLKILFITLWHIFNRKGIDNSIGGTMPLFTGNSESVDS